MQIDHLFLRAQAGAPEAHVLRAFGLIEGSANTHPGQGTANRRFFFRNAFLELLWIADDGVLSARTRATRLAERLGPAAPDVAPFGICFRPSPGDAAVPFPSWRYTPQYLPPGMAVDIARMVPLSEPMWFYLEQATAPETAPPERREPLEHPAGLRAITAVTLTVPGGEAWSLAARAAMEQGGVGLVVGEEHGMEIVFDGGASGRTHDFRPALPLIFKY